MSQEAAASLNAHLFKAAQVEILFSWLIVAAFMLYAWRSENVPPEKKRKWLLWLFLANITVLPFFWFWYVWLTPAREKG